MTLRNARHNNCDNGTRRNNFRIDGFEYKEIELPNGKQAMRHCYTIETPDYNTYEFYGLWSGHALRVECFQRPDFQKQFIGLKISRGLVIPELEAQAARWDSEMPDANPEQNFIEFLVNELSAVKSSLAEANEYGLVAQVDF